MVSIAPVDQQIIELENELEETRTKLHDLKTIGILISSILDIEAILPVVMEMSIRMVDGEVGQIQLEESGELVPKINWGVNDIVVSNITFGTGTDVSSYCFNRRETVIIDNLTPDVSFGQNISSLIAMPIVSRSRCHGIILIINKTSGESFSEQDRANLEVLINFAAVAIDNALLLKESLEQQRIRQELEIARQVQSAILPDKEVSIEGVEIGTVYIPAREVGGDFYDIIKVDDSDFLIVIGDVSNKGIPAAMVMSATSALIKSELKNFPQISPSLLMSNLNDILCKGIIKSQEMFATLFIARFDLRRKRLSYCNAGHVPPLYWSSRIKKVLKLRHGGTFVGQFPGTDFEQGELEFACGDRFFAFTDGLTEAANADNELVGCERVRQIFETGADDTAADFCLKVKEWVNLFAEGANAESIDDFTLFEVRIKQG
jgi:sigma-B regulation protein RsbU (phosphoserine phosphatase)